MHFVLTNDDGIDAPGLAALRVACQNLGRIEVVAPARAWSGMGHTVTTHAPVRVEPREAGSVAVHGTPADCVRLALHHLAPEPRWVLAGINAGGNLGADVFHSGTVAAAREAALHGVPAIAFSHYIAKGRPVDWDRAARWTVLVLNELLRHVPPVSGFWNVNFPHPEDAASEPTIVYCPVDPSPLPLFYSVEGDEFVYAGNYHSRARQAGSDVEVCFNGAIAVSRIPIVGSIEAPG